MYYYSIMYMYKITYIYCTVYKLWVSVLSVSLGPGLLV